MFIIYYLWNKIEEKCKVYLFYNQNCDQSIDDESKKIKTFMDEWIKVENKLKNTNINPIRINIEEPENIKLKKNFNVEKTPTIVKVFNNGIRDVYKGTMEYTHIMEWIYFE